MARKITRKSNKTSHVLNLLTTDPKRSEPSVEPSFEPDTAPNPESPMQPAPTVDLPAEESTGEVDPAPAENPTLPAFEEDPAPAAPAAPTPRRRTTARKPSASAMVDLSQALEERISQQIHDSLSAKLAEYEAVEAQRVKEERKTSEQIAAKAGIVLELTPEETASEPLHTDDASESTEAASASNQETASIPKTSSEQDFEIVNIMDVMLDGFQQEFMDKFGMCTCRRCWLDTRALTLSSVPAKYVVLSHDTVEAMLNFYEHRYRGMLMAQLTQACMTVMQNPHH